MDEMFMLFDQPATPVTVHLEARLEGRVEDDRLRGAITAAVARHPMARARLAPWRADATQYEWLVDDETQIDPLRTVDAADPSDLNRRRDAFYSQAIGLSESPPFRVLLVHAAAGDVVMLSANHAACDGIGALRLLQSVLRAYAGVDDPAPDIGPADIRSRITAAGGRGLRDRL